MNLQQLKENYRSPKFEPIPDCEQCRGTGELIGKNAFGYCKRLCACAKTGVAQSSRMPGCSYPKCFDWAVNTPVGNLYCYFHFEEIVLPNRNPDAPDATRVYDESKSIG